MSVSLETKLQRGRNQGWPRNRNGDGIGRYRHNSHVFFSGLNKFRGHIGPRIILTYVRSPSRHGKALEAPKAMFHLDKLAPWMAKGHVHHPDINAVKRYRPYHHPDIRSVGVVVGCIHHAVVVSWHLRFEARKCHSFSTMHCRSRRLNLISIFIIQSLHVHVFVASS